MPLNLLQKLKILADDIKVLTASIARVRPFIVTPDWRPVALLDKERLRHRLITKPEQLSLALT